jgi:hypothetical protein
VSTRASADSSRMTATHYRRRYARRIAGRLFVFTLAASAVCAMIVLRVWLAKVGA